MNKLKVLSVFEAENGDVFFEHNNHYQERTQEEIKKLFEEAKEMYDKGEVLTVSSKGDNIISYYHNGEFIGHPGIHILDNFSVFQEKIFLKRGGKNAKQIKAEKALKEMKELAQKIAKEMNEGH